MTSNLSRALAHLLAAAAHAAHGVAEKTRRMLALAVERIQQLMAAAV